MAETSASSSTQVPAAAEPCRPAADQDLVADDLLVEEISIDGMCGVY